MAFPSTVLARLEGSSSPIHALCYSASPGTYILTGSGDRTIRLYNPFPATEGFRRGEVRPGKLIQKFEAHGYEVLDLDVSRDNARFASCGGDRSVFLWDVATAKTTRRFGGNHGHTARINAVTFGGLDDSVLISGSFDASVRIWDTKSQAMKPIQILNESGDSVAAVMVPKSRPAEIWTGSVDGRVRVYDLRMGKLSTDVVGEPVMSLDATMDGSGVLVGTVDGKVRLMDCNSGGCLMAYEGAEGGEYRVKSCFGGAEKYVISGSEADGEVVAWDTVSGKLVERIKVPTMEGGKKKLDAFGKEVKRKNVISCVAWKNGGRGKEWCCAGTDGAVAVYGEGP